MSEYVLQNISKRLSLVYSCLTVSHVTIITAQPEIVSLSNINDINGSCLWKSQLNNKTRCTNIPVLLDNVWDKLSWYSFYLFLPTLMTILMQRSLYSMNQRSSTKTNVFLQETAASWVRLSVCYIGERASLGNNVTAHLSMSRLAYLFLFLFLGWHWPLCTEFYWSWF